VRVEEKDWRPLCQATPEGVTSAIALSGNWDKLGNHIASSVARMEFT
jgi:hypothetical protein